MTISVAHSAPGAVLEAGGPATPAQSAKATSTSSHDDAKLRKAAGEFESILLNSLWKSMKDTFTDQDDPDSDPTLESFNELGMQAMSSAVGNAGGLGIKNMIIHHLEPTISKGGHAANQAN